MTSTPLTSSTAPRSSGQNSNVPLLLWGVGVSVCAGAAEGVMRHHDLPGALRLALSLSPVLPALMCARELRRSWSTMDELQRMIDQLASYFALYGLLVVFVCFDLLRHAELLPTWSWTTGRLAVTMLILYALGRFGCWLRYR